MNEWMNGWISGIIIGKIKIRCMYKIIFTVAKSINEQQQQKNDHQNK